MLEYTSCLITSFNFGYLFSFALYSQLFSLQKLNYNLFSIKNYSFYVYWDYNCNSGIPCF